MNKDAYIKENFEEIVSLFCLFLEVSGNAKDFWELFWYGEEIGSGDSEVYPMSVDSYNVNGLVSVGCFDWGYTTESISYNQGHFDRWSSVSKDWEVFLEDHLAACDVEEDQ